MVRVKGIPRSISWEQVEQVLASIDRRCACGKRDYAMLLLLASYGLRAAEVAALTLDDIDWRNERLRIRDRKAGNTTTYPLSVVAAVFMLIAVIGLCARLAGWKLARYYLGGEQDKKLLNDAEASLRIAKGTAGFQPPDETYVSPKILKLYNSL